MLVRPTAIVALLAMLSIPTLVPIRPRNDSPLPSCSGVVLWDMRLAPIPAMPALAAPPVGCKLPIPAAPLVNAKNNGLSCAFVWFEPAEQGAKFAIPAALAKPAKNNVEIDQPNCEFEPHAVALREGQTLKVKNSSNMAHNFKWQGIAAANATGNKLLPPGRQIQLQFKAEKLPIVVECNIHPWMKGYVKVVDHPYFAVTDADGKFTMPAPPAGRCVLKIWHESKGWFGGAQGKNGQPINVTGQPQDLGKFAY